MRVTGTHQRVRGVLLLGIFFGCLALLILLLGGIATSTLTRTEREFWSGEEKCPVQFTNRPKVSFFGDIGSQRMPGLAVAAMCVKGPLEPGAELQVITTIYNWYGGNLSAAARMEYDRNITPIAEAGTLWTAELPYRKNVHHEERVALPQTGIPFLQLAVNITDGENPASRLGDTVFVALSCSEPFLVRDAPDMYSSVEAFCEFHLRYR